MRPKVEWMDALGEGFDPEKNLRDLIPPTIAFPLPHLLE